MTSDAHQLELGYRRLLLAYPRAYRQAKGEELLDVLMASARDGQRRPGLGDAANLIQFGLLARVRTGLEPAADRRWRDGLALFSLVAPVLLLIPALVNFFQDGYFSLPLVQAAVIAVPALLGWRRVTLAALALMVCNIVFLGGELPYYFSGFHLNNLVGTISPFDSFHLAFWLLEAIALTCSAGPRRGRHLLTWPGAIGLLAVGVLLTPIGFGDDGTTNLVELAVLIAALAMLAASSRPGRQVAVLLSLMLYPFALIFITMANLAAASHGNYDVLFSPGWLTALYLPEAAIACLAIATAVRARRAGGTPAQPGPPSDAVE